MQKGDKSKKKKTEKKYVKPKLVKYGNLRIITTLT